MKRFALHLLSGLTAMLFLTLVFSFGPGVSQAQAACRLVNSPPGVGSYFYDGSLYWGYTAQYVVPSWSSCNDINISNLGAPAGACLAFRVRFYPTSGGSYTGSIKAVCQPSGNTLIPIATAVLNGTRYRVEYITPYSSGASPYTYKLWD